MVGRLYEERCGKYGIAEGALREEVAASLADMNIDTADKVLEKLLLENRSTLGGREIDMEIASPYLTGKSGGDFGYGFGGNLK